jgi:hypothetical protein
MDPSSPILTQFCSRHFLSSPIIPNIQSDR